jgi:RNA polymerase sigma-70 factor (ECF subfamily)
MATRTTEEPFRTLFEPHRRAITLHCYRMLGSLQDAEEVVQETLLRGWQRQAEVRSTGATRSWLYKVATNACLDLLKARRRRALPHQVRPSASAGAELGPPTDEVLWVEPAPDALLEEGADDAVERPDARVSLRESVGLAFITALQFLPPKQRAVLLLIDVLGQRPQEAAALLETSVPSINSLLQRARRSVEARAEHDAPPDASSSDPALVRRYITTWESGDLEAFTALLADDAILSMPPQPEWFAGREAVRGFLAGVFGGEPRQFRLVPISANAQPAFAVYSRPKNGNASYEAVAITLLTIRGGRLLRMTKFTVPKLFPLFGLPVQVPSGKRAAGTSRSKPRSVARSRRPAGRARPAARR